MPDTKHTPGPWKVIPYTNQHGVETTAISSDDDMRNITYALPYNSPQAEANARLIAAAPDLLEALKYARRFLKPDQADLDFIDSAIAKATQP